ncbi:MAG: spore germination protein [Bacillota bacterium]|nr:spore germination protein [Bacillota bacterium]
MLSFLKQVFSSNNTENQSNNINNANNKPKTPISNNLKINKDYIKSNLNNSFDLIIREIPSPNSYKEKAILIYIGELSDKSLLEKVLLPKIASVASINGSEEELLNAVKYIFAFQDKDILIDFETTIDTIFSGTPVMLIDGIGKSFSIHIKNPPARNVEEPNSEQVIRGPREGFTESITVNVSLIRKRLNNPNLTMELFNLGQETKTNVVISYISNIASMKIVNEIKNKLASLKLESMLGSNYIEESIIDNPPSLFPLVFHTEKPDVASAKLLEGRILLLVDGSPVVLSMPTLFIEFMQSGEDYYTSYFSATLKRIIRYISLLITLTLPSTYVSLTTFHQELIPTKLVITIIQSRSSTPLPALAEVTLMLLVYEIMREAGIRMPKTLGQAVSIVGTLVIGESAVRAGLVGTPTVIIVSLTAISLFSLPSLELHSPITYMRFLLLILSGMLGFIGMICGVLFLVTNLVAKRSFGVPYMFPLCPFNLTSQEDVLVRAPINRLSKNKKTLKSNGRFISWKIHKS